MKYDCLCADGTWRTFVSNTLHGLYALVVRETGALPIEVHPN